MSPPELSTRGSNTASKGVGNDTCGGSAKIRHRLACGNADAPLCCLFSALSFNHVCVSPYDAVDCERNFCVGSFESAARHRDSCVFNCAMVIIVQRLDEKLGDQATLLAHHFDVRRLL